MTNFPDWWPWELELGRHLLDRMIDRRFSETDLRTMLDDAVDITPNKDTARWIVTTRFHGVIWEVIVEPYAPDRILKVVTAYEVD